MCGIYNYCQWNEWVNEYINCSLKTPAFWALDFYCIPFMHCSSLYFAVGLSKFDLWMCESIYSPTTTKSDFFLFAAHKCSSTFCFDFSIQHAFYFSRYYESCLYCPWLCLENWLVYFLETLYLVLGTIGHDWLASSEYLHFLIHPLMFLCD